MPARKKTSSDSTAKFDCSAGLRPSLVSWNWEVGKSLFLVGFHADYVLAKPPFNDSDTAPRACVIQQSEANMQVASGARDNNANFTWVQHFIHHLAPYGMARFIGVSIGRGACLNSVETTFAIHGSDTFENSIRHAA